MDNVCTFLAHNCKHDQLTSLSLCRQQAKSDVIVRRAPPDWIRSQISMSLRLAVSFKLQQSAFGVVANNLNRRAVPPAENSSPKLVSSEKTQRMKLSHLERVKCHSTLTTREREPSIIC